jgi:Flp pilus assembly pilin Flp
VIVYALLLGIVALGVVSLVSSIFESQQHRRS